MSLFRKIRLYLLTIRYLKMEQIVYRAYYRLVRPSISDKVALSVHSLTPKVSFL